MKTIGALLSKNLLRIAACALLAAMLPASGCQRDFPNPNAPIVDDVTIQSLVAGAQAGMRVDYAVYLRCVSVVGREAYYFEPADPRYTGELLYGRPDPGGFLVNRPWSARYRTVAVCRFLLEKAASLPASSKAGVEGFARTIIAYQLLLNLDYEDANGIKLDFSGSPTAPFVSKADALTAIAGLLDDANTSLAAAGGSFNFKLAGGFAGFDTPPEFAKFNRALRARVALYQGDDNGALAALGASFLDTGAPLSLGVYHVYGLGLADQTNEIYESPTAPFVKFMAHPTFKTDAETGDTRVTSKTAVRPSATTFDNLTSDLALTILGSSTAPVPIIRNEELILLRAEANIGAGNLPAAQADINIVRAAAGLGPVTLTSTTAVDQLLHERRYSLFMEGHRWVDLRRYFRLSQLPVDRPATDAILDKMPRPETEPNP
jgi:hypothetical protein